jgi:hypothetical protein
VHPSLIAGYRTMEALEFLEQTSVSNNSPSQTGTTVFVGDVKSQSTEDFGSKAERPVDIARWRCRLSGVRLIAVDEEHLAGRSGMCGAAISVLLDAGLDETDYKMRMRVTHEPVRDVVCMNDLGVIWTLEAVDANPLCSCGHGVILPPAKPTKRH